MTAVPEMVERVARALTTAAGHDPDGSVQTMIGKAAIWTLGVEQARAAIAAMREPTGVVVEAVESKAEERCRAAPAMTRWYGEDVWAAGIDAALGNPPVAR